MVHYRLFVARLKRAHCFWLAGLVAAWTLSGGAAASAQTVNEALVRVSASNPDIIAAREALAAAKAQVNAARGAGLPSAAVTGTAGVSHLDYEVSLPGFERDDISETYAAQASVTQPIYTGGRIKNAVSAASAAADAAKAQLAAVEQDIFLKALAAYFNVLRDGPILDVRLNNEALVNQRLQQVRGLVDAGRATKTDLRQAEARLAGAQAQRIEAAGRLEASRAAFERVIGVYPEKLPEAGPLVGVPETLDEATALADDYSPLIRVAEFAQDASEYRVKVEAGARRPEIGVQGYALYGRTSAINSSSAAYGITDNDLTSVGVMMRLKMPLYQGGVPAAKTRAAKHEASQRAWQTEAVRRQVREAAVLAWHDSETARSVVAARKLQIVAAERALEGVVAEHQVGRRTLLDVLDAQQELSDATAAKLASERDYAMARYSLLAVVGRLTSEEIGILPE